LDIIESILSLGKLLQDLLVHENNCIESVELKRLIVEANHYNRWFTEVEVKRRIHKIAAYITSDPFLQSYQSIPKSKKSQKIALVSEEKIPLEEFFTIVTILLSNNITHYKTNRKEDKILVNLVRLLLKCNPELENRILFVDGPLHDFDKIIVTSREPLPETKLKILKKHCTLEITRYQSVGVIKQSDTTYYLTSLADDVFNYFGMGSENIRKVYIPDNYPINRIFEAFEKWHDIILQNTYANNYQYHQSVYLMNLIKHLDNGFILLKEEKAMRAPTGVLFFEYYKDEQEIMQFLDRQNDINSIYNSSPKNANEKSFGSSADQLFIPSQKVINFLS
jgi:hypothetical protein